MSYLLTPGDYPPPVRFAGPTKPAAHVQKIKLEQLAGDPLQPRKHFDDVKLQELADSLKSHGQLQPVLVRPSGRGDGQWLIVAGERRFRAAQRAGLATLDCIVMSDHLASGTGVREAQVIENLIRQDLSPMETGRAYADLIKIRGCSQAELARLLSVGTATVSRALALVSTEPKPPKTARRKKRGKQTVRLSHEGTTAIVKLKAGVDLVEWLAGRVAALRAVDAVRAAAAGDEQQQAAA